MTRQRRRQWRRGAAALSDILIIAIGIIIVWAVAGGPLPP